LHDADGDEAARRIDEYSEFYAEVHAEPPYSWGPEYAELFRRRFETRSSRPGPRARSSGWASA
jgi:hypothetical protein